MAKSNDFMHTPSDYPDPFTNNKGTSSGTYDGMKGDPWGQHPRTSGTGVPEKIIDGGIPTTGIGDVILPNEMPKHHK